MYAAMHGQISVIRMLLEQNVRVDATDQIANRTALMYASIANRDTAMQMLLHYGANVDAQDKDGETAIMKAAHAGNEAVVRTL